MSKKTIWSVLGVFVVFGMLLAQVLLHKEITCDIEILADPDFNITAEVIGVAQVHRGATVEFFITAEFTEFDGQVALSTANVPVGLTVSFTRNILEMGQDPVTGNSLMQTRMIVEAATDAPIGPLSFTVIGDEVSL